LEKLSLTATSFIKEGAKYNQTYPKGFFTLPDVETHLGHARKPIGATVVGYAPIVMDALEHALWETYSFENIGWVEDSYQVSVEFGNNMSHVEAWEANVEFFNPNIWHIQKYDHGLNGIVIDEQTALTCPSFIDDDKGKNQETYSHIVAESPENGPFAPIWVHSPPPNPVEASNINFNLLRDPIFRLATRITRETNITTFLDICQSVSTWFTPGTSESGKQPYSLVVTPVWDDHSDNSTMVGYFFAAVPWVSYLENVFDSRNDNPVIAVLQSQCGDKTTSFLMGSVEPALLSINEDVHVRSQHYEDMARTANLTTMAKNMDANPIVNEDTGEIICSSTTFTITVYPTEQFEQNFATNAPLFYTLIVLSIFFFTILAFFLFDCLVQRRQSSIMNTALRQNALVSSLFPQNIQKQLMADIDAEAVKNKTGKAGLRSYLNNEAVEIEEASLEAGPKSKPIADLFPETTIMFADIAGGSKYCNFKLLIAQTCSDTHFRNIH
jgi:hypothetical protein